jgi:hypothetical protein
MNASRCCAAIRRSGDQTRGGAGIAWRDTETDLMFDHAEIYSSAAQGGLLHKTMRRHHEQQQTLPDA